MGVGGTAGRSIKLRQRQRRMQFEALRFLLLCDGDGGEESFLRRRHIQRILPEQNFAASAVKIRVAPVSPVSCASASASSIRANASFTPSRSASSSASLP